MIYFEASDLGYAPLIKNWINTLPKDLPYTGVDLLNELLEFSLTRGKFRLIYFSMLRLIALIDYKALSFSK
jgi:hypothetical protein